MLYLRWVSPQNNAILENCQNQNGADKKPNKTESKVASLKNCIYDDRLSHRRFQVRVSEKSFEWHEHGRLAILQVGQDTHGGTQTRNFLLGRVPYPLGHTSDCINCAQGQTIEGHWLPIMQDGFATIGPRSARNVAHEDTSATTTTCPPHAIIKNRKQH